MEFSPSESERFVKSNVKASSEFDWEPPVEVVSDPENGFFA